MWSEPRALARIVVTPARRHLTERGERSDDETDSHKGDDAGYGRPRRTLRCGGWVDRLGGDPRFRRCDQWLVREANRNPARHRRGGRQGLSRLRESDQLEPGRAGWAAESSGTSRSRGSARTARSGWTAGSAWSTRTSGDAGPQGPQGPPGPSNVLIFNGAPEVGSSNALCPTGWRATGGGGLALTVGHSLTASFPLPLLPAGTPTRWRVEDQLGGSVVAWVVCVS